MEISINGLAVDRIELTGNEPEFGSGYGVFETLRTYFGKPFELPGHLRRLRQSAAEISLVVSASDDDITTWVQKHCSANTETSTDKQIKIIAAEHNLYILSEDLNINNQEYTKGVKVKLTHVQRPFPNIKSLSYLPEYLAHRAASQEGYHDALLLNDKQEVTEGAHSNFFYVKDNTIFTARNNILQGITREIVLRIAEPHYQIVTGKLALDAVLLGHECFLTQSSRGVVPIVQIDERKVGNGKPGAVTKHVMELFNAYVESNLDH